MYICNVCGYLYEDEKEAIPFPELPDTWCCPVCSAPRDDFQQMSEKYRGAGT